MLPNCFLRDSLQDLAGNLQRARTTGCSAGEPISPEQQRRLLIFLFTSPSHHHQKRTQKLQVTSRCIFVLMVSRGWPSRVAVAPRSRKTQTQTTLAVFRCYPSRGKLP